MQLYSILDSENYITHCVQANECPQNGTPLLNTQFIKPRLIDGVLIEGAKPEEINISKREKNNLQFLELQPTDWYFTRLQETGKLVPLEILEQRANIRAKYL